MDIYTAIQDFSLPHQGVLVTVGTTLGKFSSKTSVLVGAVEFNNQALWDWLGSPNSLLYVSFSGTVPEPTGSSVVVGASAVTSGNDFVTVSGAAFGFVPVTVVATVLKPTAAGSNLFATVRSDSITADGFTADLSAPVGAPGYVLAFVVSE